EIKFEKVIYGVPAEQTLIIENSGNVVCEFRFVVKPGADGLIKKWLKISPSTGILLPNEKTQINICISIDNSTAPDFNSGKERLDDILVLHLKNGRDYF